MNLIISQLDELDGKPYQEEVKSARQLSGDYQKSDLLKVLMKSKIILETYKKKEIQWTKEKKELIAIIERLKKDKLQNISSNNNNIN